MLAAATDRGNWTRARAAGRRRGQLTAPLAPAAADGPIGTCVAGGSLLPIVLRHRAFAELACRPAHAGRVLAGVRADHGPHGNRHPDEQGGPEMPAKTSLILAMKRTVGRILALVAGRVSCRLFDVESHDLCPDVLDLRECVEW